jgi:hypothetical protein
MSAIFERILPNRELSEVDVVAGCVVFPSVEVPATCANAEAGKRKLAIKSEERSL